MVAQLEYLHVIDITQGIAGPSCTQMLAWLGASVVKVEPLGTGDPERRCLQDVPDTDSLGFVQLNTNKRSIAVDLASPDGARILRDLLAQADLFVEDRGPAALEGLGLAWDSVHTLNPRLIMGSLSCTNPVTAISRPRPSTRWPSAWAEPPRTPAGTWGPTTRRCSRARRWAT